MNKVKNHKITIIPSELDSPDYVCKGKFDSDDLHGNIMRKYGVLTYGNDSIFNILDDDCITTTVEYFLELYGNVVFYNLSDDFGILCVMGEINEKQRKALDVILKQLSDYIIEMDYYMLESHNIDFYEPFEDSGEFLDIKSYLDSVTVKNKVKVYE